MTGFIVLVVLVGGILILRNIRNKNESLPTPSPSIEQKISETFNGMTIPDDVDRAELKDVSGGDGFGIATRTEILVDLPEAPLGQYYQAKLMNSEGKSVLLGTLKAAKGGYLIEYNSSRYPGYDKVVIVLGEKTLLEGSF